MIMTRIILLGGAATIALVLAMPAAAQQAASPPSDDTASSNDAQPGDIVVTAQKRSERLQDVPVAVSVVSGDALQRLSTNNIEDTQALVPALTFVKGDTSLNSALFLRGLGTVSFSIAAEPSVTSVLDGVVLSRAGESFGDLYDIDRIEVLRGPQGTLFGKNASAGVINVVTKEPGDKLGGYAELGYFDRNEFKAKGSISGPIGGGWRAGLTGFYGKYDGNIYDSTTKSWINGYKHYGGRAQLVGNVGDNLKLRFIADYRKSDDNCCAFVIGALSPTAATQPAVTNILAPVLAGGTRGSIQSLPNRTVEETYGFSLQADLAVGQHTLTSITSYRKWNNEEVRDGDWVDQVYTTVPLIHDDGPEKASTFTQELRLTSPTGGFIDYVVGAFYYRAVARRIYTRSDTYCTASPAAPLPSGLTPCPAGSTILNPIGTANFGSVFENEAVFGQATWHFTPKLRLITGLRYTHDDVSTDHIRVDNFPSTGFPGVGGPAGIAANFDQGVYDSGGVLTASNGVPWRGKTSANNLSGKAALEYQLTRDHLAYFSYSRGYKGPAFNTFFNMAYLNTAPIAPELSDAFEVGLKNTFDNGRIVLNLTGFLDKVRNYQANYPTTVNGAVTTTIINAGNVSTRGVEIEWQAHLSTPFTVTGGFSYTDAHVDQFLSPPAAQAGNAIAPGTPLAFAPKLKGSVGAVYTITPSTLPFGIELSGQASFLDKQVSTLQSTNTVAQVQTFQALTIPAHDQVDLSVAAVGQQNRYRVAFVVKNLFNQHFATTLGTGGPGGSILYQIPHESDRYVGVTGRINF
jgi:iron complex outermembrane receptor protein